MRSLGGRRQILPPYKTPRENCDRSIAVIKVRERQEISYLNSAEFYFEAEHMIFREKEKRERNIRIGMNREVGGSSTLRGTKKDAG